MIIYLHTLLIKCNEKAVKSIGESQIPPKLQFQSPQRLFKRRIGLIGKRFIGTSFGLFFRDFCLLVVFRERICKISTDKLAYCFRPSGGMADAGDLKSPAHNGRVGSNPTSAIFRRA